MEREVSTRTVVGVVVLATIVLTWLSGTDTISSTVREGVAFPLVLVSAILGLIELTRRPTILATVGLFSGAAATVVIGAHGTAEAMRDNAALELLGFGLTVGALMVLTAVFGNFMYQRRRKSSAQSTSEAN